MRYSPALAAVLTLTITLLATTPAAARDPIALGVSSQHSTDLAALDAFAAEVGARPATWTLWSTWGDRGGSKRCVMGLGTCAFPGELVRGLRSRGVTPVVYWQPTNPANPTGGWYERHRNIAAGKHDPYIRAWARAAKAFGGPVIVRFAHEMNGTWFPWSLGNFDNSPGRFVAAWRHVVRIFRAVGARNVRFLWSPFQRCSTCHKARYADFYPGNRYVDYVGVTALNWGDVAWTPLEGLLEEPLATLRGLTRTGRNPGGKPVILPELGSNHLGGDKAAWITQGYLAAYERWPAIRAINYFDYDTTFAGQPDWRLVQPPDRSAFGAYQSLATRPEFRAALPLRPSANTGGWKLMPLVHVVAQDGTGRFATIAEAVAAAAVDDVIVIRPGTYDEAVTLDKDLSISGAGEPGAVVISPSGAAAAFTLTGSDASISNLTLRGGPAGVVISGGAPTLDGLRLEDSQTAAIQIASGSRARIRGNIISGGEVGIMVSESAPKIVGNDVAGTTSAGIQLDGSEGQLTGNLIHDNQAAGVTVLRGAATLSDNSITANSTGLLVGAGATPILSGNIVCGNATDVATLDGAPLPDTSANEPCPNGTGGTS